MSEVKAGDRIVVNQIDGFKLNNPVVRTVVNVDDEKEVFAIGKSIEIGGEHRYVLETHEWMWNDDWRYAKEGDGIMGTPEVGDLIVVEEYYDDLSSYVIGGDTPSLAKVSRNDGPALFEAVDVEDGYEYHIPLIETSLPTDKWRYAIRKGDELLIEKINGADTDYPTVVTALGDEHTHGTVFFRPEVYGDTCLWTWDSDGEDVWEFYERNSEKEPIDYINESFSVNGVDWKVSPLDRSTLLGGTTPDPTDEELGKLSQSYTEFNSEQGGGKTLKDYTGVSITDDSLSFKSSQDKTLEGISPSTLNFKQKAVEDTVDNVNHPGHYSYGDIEVIDFIEQVTNQYEGGFDAYIVGNAIKYLARSPHKGGLEDVKKAAWYLNHLIKRNEDE